MQDSINDKLQSLLLILDEEILHLAEDKTI